jgi:hypothetical protein
LKLYALTLTKRPLQFWKNKYSNMEAQVLCEDSSLLGLLHHVNRA